MIGCDERATIGNARTVGHVDLAGPQDLLGRNRWEMRIRVRRWRVGSGPPVVSRRREAHGKLRSDREFLLLMAADLANGQIVREAVLVDRGLIPRIVQQGDGTGGSRPL